MRTILSVLFIFAVNPWMMAHTTVDVTIENPLKVARTDQPVVLSLRDYKMEVRQAIVRCGNQEIPCQLDDLDQDETFDELCFLADLQKGEKKHYQVTLLPTGEPRSYPARVYTEMLVPNTKDKTLKKNQQNNYLEAITARGDAAYTYNVQHHHGVAFESELNAIRIYFDARQTLDVYGKVQKRLELKDTQFYTAAEQKEQGYGDDVLWVGQTFGLGAFRGWNGQQPTLVEPVRSRTQRVISYGPLRTIVEVFDRGWLPAGASQPVNMTLRYIQYAGHRDTDVEVLFNRDVTGYRFSTGIINVKNSTEYSDHQGLRACWGTDYPSTAEGAKLETVGLAVYVPQQNIVSEEPANKDNYAFVLKVDGRKMTYKVACASANESFGYHTADAWFDYLKAWRNEIDHPVIVKTK